MALLLGAVSSTALAPVSTPGRAATWKAQLPQAIQAQLPDAAPAHLTGALAGDSGFDPLLLTALANKPVQDVLPFIGSFPSMVQREIIMANQSPEQQLASVQWMREAEIKHARLAMLAAVGWPLAELINPWSLSETGGRAPSLFNGGLFDGPVPFFCVLSFMAAAVLENKYEERVAQRKQLLWATPGAVPTSAGDFGFDPMGISKEEGRSRQKELRGAELYNGRLAMLAITGFAVQEFLWSKPVIEQTPFFFGR